MAYITGIIGMRLPESALVVWWAFIKSKKDAKIEDGRRGGWCCAADFGRRVFLQELCHIADC